MIPKKDVYYQKKYKYNLILNFMEEIINLRIDTT